MGSDPTMVFAAGAKRFFSFRPWVRRAGLSIVLVAAAVTVAIILAAWLTPSWRYGWIGERFTWIYIGTLWIGGLKIWLGTMRPVAEIDGQTLVLRPLHQIATRRIAWNALSGTEQMIGGDRMIVYYDTAKGMRFVALNLNLIKGRRDFLALVDMRLAQMGFTEKVVERSRYRSRTLPPLS
jgi:hypothetical protein